MTLVDTESNSAGEDYLPPLKRFAACRHNMNGVDMLSYILKQFHSFIPDAELEDSILKYNPIPSNVPPPVPLDEFLRGVLEENHKYSQMQQEKLFKKCSKMY